MGAGPIHSSLLLPDGRLAVLSWEQKTRRLQLLELKPGEAFPSRSLVTLSEDTNTVALLVPPDQESVPAHDAPGRLFFLYDETRIPGQEERFTSCPSFPRDGEVDTEGLCLPRVGSRLPTSQLSRSETPCMCSSIRTS